VYTKPVTLLYVQQLLGSFQAGVHGQRLFLLTLSESLEHASSFSDSNVTLFFLTTLVNGAAIK